VGNGLVYGSLRAEGTELSCHAISQIFLIVFIFSSKKPNPKELAVSANTHLSSVHAKAQQ